MKRFFTLNLCALVGVLVVAFLVGCGAPESANSAPAGYAGALDASMQLALGTLKLEGTGDAVTEDQAATLLPLWQALVSGGLKGEAERSAVARQIESSMSETQIAAIAGMRLTAEDLRTWAASQAGRAAPGGQGQGGRQQPGGGQGGQGGAGPQMSDEERATRRAQFQNMSPEELATRRAQFGQGSAGGERPAQQGGAFGGPLAAVIALLSERSGTIVTPAVARQRPFRTPTPTGAPVRTQESTPTALPTETPDIEPTFTLTTVPTAVPTSAQEPSPTPTTASVASMPARAPAQAVYVDAALEQLPDSDPGPPLTIEVSANRAYPDPLVEQSRTYQVSGIARNDSPETYAVSGILATFFDADGFRGTFDPAIRDGKVVGGEWNWHGQTEAQFAALLLAPGEAWPFMAEMTAQDMASFVLHPDASVTDRQSALLEASGLHLARDGTEYVTISGQVTNVHPFKIKNVILSGVLLDAKGEIVSLGSSYLVEEDIQPGQSVDFDIRIHDSMYSVKTPFDSYRVYAQAERDWD